MNLSNYLNVLDILFN